MLVCAAVVATAYFEFRHRSRFGHFVPYGLHVDVLSRDVSIGIPGQTKMYWAELSNFSILPVRLNGCDYVTDAFDKGTKYPYAVQRWDGTDWQTVSEETEKYFCHPAPLSTINTDSIVRRLWPGMSVEVMEGEATGARDAFQKGDRARFVVLRKVGDWRGAVASDAFIIEDDVPRDSGPSRVKH